MSERRPGHSFDDESSSTSNQPNSALAVFALIVAILALAVGLFAPLHPDRGPKTPTITPAQLQSLRDSVVELKNDVAYLKAHTDTTGLADMRQELQAMKANDEQRSHDIIEMTDAFNRVYINGAPKR